MVVEFLAILWLFTKLKLHNISGNHAVTWQQKLAADLPLLIKFQTTYFGFKHELSKNYKINTQTNVH